MSNTHGSYRKLIYKWRVNSTSWLPQVPSSPLPRWRSVAPPRAPSAPWRAMSRRPCGAPAAWGASSRRSDLTWKWSLPRSWGVGRNGLEFVAHMGMHAMKDWPDELTWPKVQMCRCILAHKILPFFSDWKLEMQAWKIFVFLQEDSLSFKLEPSSQRIPVVYWWSIFRGSVAMIEALAGPKGIGYVCRLFICQEPSRLGCHKPLPGVRMQLFVRIHLTAASSWAATTWRSMSPQANRAFS